MNLIMFPCGATRLMVSRQSGPLACGKRHVHTIYEQARTSPPRAGGAPCW